jgi:hypothetical protein
MKETDRKMLMSAGLMAAAYFFIIKPLSKAFGKSDADIQTEVLYNNVSNFFNPNYWKTGGIIFKDATAYNLTGRLNSAIGIFYDDEAEITAVFKSLRYKNQVSYLAYKYAERYNRDLLTDLVKNLSSDELAPIYAYIKTLPTGK